MTVLLRRVLITVAVLLLLLVLAFVALTAWINPNDYKDRIQALAAEQGVALQLDGELGWQLFPVLAIELSQVKVASTRTPAKPLAAFEQVAASVRLLPLLSGQIQVDAISIDGASVTAEVNKKGANNWQFGAVSAATPAGQQAPAAADQPAQPATSTSNTSTSESAAAPMSLAISSLQITDMALSYDDKSTATQVSVDQLNLEISDLNMDGELFPLRLSARLSELTGVPPVLLDVSGKLSFKDNLLTLNPMQASLVPVQSEPGRLVLDVSGSIDLHEAPVADLAVTLNQIDPRAWLAVMGVKLTTADPKALSALHMTSTVRVNGDYVSLAPLVIGLDDTEIKGSVYLNQPQQLPLVVDLAINQLNVDRYLAPVAETATDGAAMPKAGAGGGKGAGPGTTAAPATPLPLDMLRNLQYKAMLAIEQLQVKQAHLSSVVVESHANKGLLDLDQLSLNAYEGTATAQGRLNVRGQTAKANLTAQLSGVELLGLLTDMAAEQRLSGKIGATINATSAGTTVEDLISGLSANSTINGEALKVQELDIERSVCELSAMLNQETFTDRTWRGYTPLQDLQAELALKDQVLDLTRITSGVDALQVNASGQYKMKSGKFDIPLAVRISGNRQDGLSCQIQDRWRNRDLPLRCKGTLGKLGAGTCLPDKSKLGDLAKDEVKAKAKEKLSEKLQEKLGGDKDEPLQNLLKGLLNN